MLEFAAPEIAEAVSGKKNSRQLQRMWKDRVWENSRVVVTGRRLQAESLQQNLQNKPVGCEETFLQTILINRVEQLSVSNFCGSFWKPWRESPSR